MNLGVNAVQVFEHSHLQVVVAHGEKAVLGLNEVDAHEPASIASLGASVLTRRIKTLLDSFKPQ